MSKAKSYSMAANPSPYMAWDEYEVVAANELRLLLDSGECDEHAYHALLERHPCLLPSTKATFGGGHHGLVNSAVISLPSLPGLTGKIPDFALLERDSANVYAVLVEIESPCKRWFTDSGQPRAELTQAINQLRDWKRWFQQPGNRDKFLHEYQVPADFRKRGFETRYLLVYGRRNELERNWNGPMRAQHEQPDERFLTYDSLSPNINHRDAITVRMLHGKYTAKVIPPTLRLGPWHAQDQAAIKDKASASDSHPLMSAARSDFLRSRFGYWDDWAARHPNGFHEFERE